MKLLGVEGEGWVVEGRVGHSEALLGTMANASVGQVSTHSPQPRQSSAMWTISPSSDANASNGHRSRHTSHQMHRSESSEATLSANGHTPARVPLAATARNR